LNDLYEKAVSLEISLKDSEFTKFTSDEDFINSVANIRVVYDQGSSELKDSSKIISYMDGYWIFFYILFYIFYFGIVIYYRRIRIRKIYFSHIVNNLLSIRHILKFKIGTDLILENPWDDVIIEVGFWESFLIGGLKMAVSKRWRQKYIPKRIKTYRKRLDINDYITLEDFYTLLDTRNNFLKNDFNGNTLKLKEENKKILKFANEILTSINWNKYR
jgi:hypothetical protein